MFPNMANRQLGDLFALSHVSFMWDGRVYETCGEETEDCQIPVIDTTTGIPDAFGADFVPRVYMPLSALHELSDILVDCDEGEECATTTMTPQV